MEVKLLSKRIAQQLDELKAFDIKEIDVRERTTIADLMLICSGKNTRHVKSLADNIVTHFKKEALCPGSLSGTDLGEWALVDYGNVLVHIMLPEIRAFYNLEELWSEENATSMSQPHEN